jgi:hypothetical protein
MTPDFDATYSALLEVFAPVVKNLHVQKDTAMEYTLETTVASPFPQHKGHAMYFGSVRKGKAYVSFHLMPLYMNAKLTASISPELKKRMQGKTCFNFKTVPEASLLQELKRLTKDGLKDFQARKWA